MELTRLCPYVGQLLCAFELFYRTSVTFTINFVVLAALKIKCNVDIGYLIESSVVVGPQRLKSEKFWIGLASIKLDFLILAIRMI